MIAVALDEVRVSSNRRMVWDSAQQHFIRALPMIFVAKRHARLQCTGLMILDGRADQLISTPSMQKASQVRGEYWGLKLKHLFQFLILTFLWRINLKMEEI